ncbi:MAG: N-acetylmuramoyl-L-alanine amidase, family 2, partial [Marmoricola sp.]|nr:N-acetylmuramoyl-L-alanine amidase, family 2 [Marmoricola sp.]
MRFSRTRYVTLCQQSLVTGAVLVVGISAAGVKTLDIVPTPGVDATASGALGSQATRAPLGVAPVPAAPGTTAPAPAASSAPVGPVGSSSAPASSGSARVDAAPVTPKVREVAVEPLPAATPAPSRGARTQHRAPTRPDADRTLVARSAPQRVTGYATVGVTWEHGVSYAGRSLLVQVRTRQDDTTWSGWTTLSHDEEDGPDAGSADLGPRSRPGTDALVVGAVDQVQMRAETTDGSAPPDLKLAVIDPGAGRTRAAQAAQPGVQPGAQPGVAPAQPTDQPTAQPAATGDTAAPASDTVALSAATRVARRTVAMPRIYTRAEWGANESLRDQSSPGYGTVEAGFIHHTVNANNYTADQVPALMRGIYAYHTQSRGWRDIGYNYLVDRFGRIWEGRWGGITKAVLGAHTLGYNEVSFAMSAIGNYDIAAPSEAVLDAYARLYAWKLALYGIRADATHLWVKDRYLNAINGHRDVGQTACPGKYLYAKIPYIRTLAQEYQDNGGGTTAPVPAPAPAPAPAPTATSPMTSPTQKPIAWAAQSGGIAFPKVTSLTGTTHPDLVLQRTSDGLIQVVPMGGQVGYAAPVTTPAHWSTMNLVSAVGDVTGDGRGDVLARLAKDGTTRVYVGDGRGHVAVPGVHVTNAFRSATAIVAAGDWNHDGRPDVLMTDGTATAGRLWLVPGRGAGLFGTPVLLSSRWNDVRSTAVA